MKSLTIIVCLTVCAIHRNLLAESEPFRLQLDGQSKVELDLVPLIKKFYKHLEVSQRIVNQRPQDEILKPPAAIASRLSFIDIGTSRPQVEKILGHGWFEDGGEYLNSGFLAEYRNRTFPDFMIQVWYGWTERHFTEGRLIRHAASQAPVLARPAVVKTKLPLPDKQ